MKVNTPKNLPFLIRIYFIVGSVIIVISVLLYNNNLISRMREQAESTSKLFSRFTTLALYNVEESGSRDFIREIREYMVLPFVITDVEGRPMIWNEVDLPQVKDDEFNRLLDFDPENPEDPLLERVLEKAREFDSITEPDSIETEGMRLVIHYGRSKLASELRFAPYVQLGVFVLFVLFGFIGFRALKMGEQRSIWVGMAKETAHQLGTPISSLMGWLAILKAEIASSDENGKIGNAVREAELDVGRLSRISSRFSKIGSATELEYQDIRPIILETVDYFIRRRPALRIKSIIDVKLDEMPMIRCSKDLVGWVFENMIKNSLDAISGKEGNIEITGGVDEGGGNIRIIVSDTGDGIPQAMRKRVFAPGVTTKRRGWGLGLALVKRIIEEIHHGSIKVIDSRPGRGATFQLTFPID